MRFRTATTTRSRTIRLILDSQGRLWLAHLIAKHRGRKVNLDHSAEFFLCNPQGRISLNDASQNSSVLHTKNSNSVLSHAAQYLCAKLQISFDLFALDRAKFALACCCSVESQRGFLNSHAPASDKQIVYQLSRNEEGYTLNTKRSHDLRHCPHHHPAKEPLSNTALCCLYSHHCDASALAASHSATLKASCTGSESHGCFCSSLAPSRRTGSFCRWGRGRWVIHTKK